MKISAALSVLVLMFGTVGAIAPSANLPAQASLPGRSTLTYQQKTRQIVRVDYTSGSVKSMRILLQDGHVLRLQGRLGLSGQRQVFVIEDGSFSQNRGAAVSGKLYVTVKNGQLRSMSGSVYSENQSLYLTYSPETDATYPGTGGFDFRGTTTAIDSVVYTDGQGAARVLKINLRDGRVFKLQGFLDYANDLNFVVSRAEFLSSPSAKGNPNATVTGTLQVRRQYGQVRSVEGNLKFDSQAIGVRFVVRES